MITIEGIRVAFEKDGILVVDKPSGLLSQPGKGPDLMDSVLTRVKAAFPWAELVHRLDRDTSGLLMLALNPKMHRAMSMAFATRKVDKDYIGLCEGELMGRSGTIVCPLARIATNPPQYAAHPEGKIAVTHWQHLGTENWASRVRLTPITGRSHQLRAHLQMIGHPLLGDPIYGNADRDRLKLHAERLCFQFPEDGPSMELISPAPF
jgi:tRNA pseudouridine32 synthase/23S rRNA pseudouridine746 synthase